MNDAQHVAKLNHLIADQLEQYLDHHPGLQASVVLTALGEALVNLGVQQMDMITPLVSVSSYKRPLMRPGTKTDPCALSKIICIGTYRDEILFPLHFLDVFSDHINGSSKLRYPQGLSQQFHKYLRQFRPTTLRA